MNFLLRHSSSSAAIAAAVSTTNTDNLPPVSPWLKKFPSQTVTTLDGLMAVNKSLLGDHTTNNNSNAIDSDRDSFAANMNDVIFKDFEDKHVDVRDDEGCITIPIKKLPDNWDDAADIQRFQSQDRSFVFPGEHVHIIACLSASKQDIEILAASKVAALLNKNDLAKGAKNENGNVAEFESPVRSESVEHENTIDAKGVKKYQVDVSTSEPICRMEHSGQTQTLLQRFKDSHFFVRISESGEHLWSERGSVEALEMVDDIDSMENSKTTVSRTPISAVIDNARFDARASGGVARNSIKCCSLANGDVLIVLQVNVGVNSLRDPILEILQFEKYHDRTLNIESDVPVKEEHHSCRELLKWLLPLDNSQLPISRSLSPPLLNSFHKMSFSASGGSQLLGHFRSYSMSSLPLNNASVSSPSMSAGSLKPSFDLENWDRFVPQKSIKSTKSGDQGLLSFRGVSLEPERFSVCCGLEGTYIPGRRWRKQLEMIQPVDIHSFAANCNTDDLLCVQIKNICPAHVPDTVIYVDTITIILDEASDTGQLSSIPVACNEAGISHSLPNLALRRGEEHSFILKPAISALNNPSLPDDKKSKLDLTAGIKTITTRLPPVAVEGVKNKYTHKYAVLVSCRSNYSESRLFFKKPTDWRPHIPRDFMMSVAPKISKQTLEFTGEVSQLPVQVLTLQASNLTSEDLTLILLAPALFTRPPSVLSLNSSPSSPSSSFSGFTATQNISTMTGLAERQTQSASQTLPSDQQGVPVATASSCTHLWMHTRIPLGHVPSQSTAKIKLELLPLTDGIVTLDTLQIYVKEKGLTYIPEHALKINATSSIATGII